MIVTLASVKGGVGKSTCAIHIAAYLRSLASTLLVDSDRIRSCVAWSKRGKHTGQLKRCRRCGAKFFLRQSE